MGQLRSSCFNSGYQVFIARVPLGRWGNLDEIGGLWSFSPATPATITGAAIAIDGGWTVQ